MKLFERKHPLAIRWFHWVNFPLLTIMIWSGLLIYWANDVYRLGPFHFFPDALYEALDVPGRLAEGMAWHFTFMWLFLINGIGYVSYVIASGEWRVLVPNKHSFYHAWLTILHDLKIKKDAPPPQKFNGAQQIVYTAVVFMGAGSIITGLAIYKPTQLAWLTNLLGGYQAARLEHFVLTVGYVLFFALHVAQVVRAGWNAFRAMITGYEIRQSKTLSPSSQARVKSLSRRKFIWFGATSATGFGLWYWLRNAEPIDDAQWPLRKALEANGALSSVVFTPYQLAPTYAAHLAKMPKANGTDGLEGEWDPATWSLQVSFGNSNTNTTPLGQLSMDDIRALPRTEMVTELKCIEGWSEIVAWAGVKFSDFVEHFETKWQQDLKSFSYVSLVTPDGVYFVGMDMASMLHPQTLLCYEMNGQTLTLDHGFPLRLATPLKYGIKNIKRIATLRFTNVRPDDFWAQQGYDWHAGH